MYFFDMFIQLEHVLYVTVEERNVQMNLFLPVGSILLCILCTF